ncbi:MAG TPA: XRE family transcriptional regulator [Actinomycetota bacterium]|nr:XRE family transcriptional regulator [Actinomycetota bacterium]
MKFNPLRLSVARQRRLLNKKAFADLVGVTAHTVVRCEQGDTEPSEQTVAKFAEVLGFPVGFFYRQDVEVADAELVSFRSQRSMTAAERDAALAAGAIGFEISDWVEARFDLPGVAVPDLNLYEPEMAAVLIRQDWGLGEEPISNTVHLLESKGVRVFSLAENSKRVNAFSLWRQDKPYVFLNTMKTAENSRFDAAHELGHLVLHQDGQTTGRVAEDEANRFASAFLMPEGPVVRSLRRAYSVEQLIVAKRKWRVSLLALTVRLHRLGVLTDWRYRDFCIQIRARYGDTEPEGVERERSVVWEKVMKTLWSERVTQLDIARALDVPESEVSTLIFGILHSDNKSPPQGGGLSLVANSKRSSF